jgi:lipoate-protein ligase B
MDIKAYLRDLEEVAIRTLRKFQIRGERGAQTGVWVGGRKIASIGIALRHWVTFHGLALNADPDLDYFRRIRPCGLEGETITSMVEVLGKGVYLPTVKEEFKHHFQEVFGVHLRPVDEALLGLL